MYSYGYKIPRLQEQIARQGSSVTEAPVEPGDIFEDESASGPASSRIPAPPRRAPVTVSGPRRNLTGGSPAQTSDRLTPREFFESQILPEVRAVIGDLGVADAYTIARDDAELARIRSEGEAQSERSRKSRLESLRGTPVPTSLNLPEEISLRGLGRYEEQPGIPGLFEQIVETNEGINQLRSQRIAGAFGDLLAKYPELNSIFYTKPDPNARASRVRKAGFAPYLDYVDKEQVFSDPEDRADLYNKAIANKDNLLGKDYDNSDFAETLRLIESDYVSGDTARQTEARQLLKQFLPDPADLEKIETPAFRETRPVIGGGKYVDIANNPLVERINKRADEFDQLYGQLTLQDRMKLGTIYPGFRELSTNSSLDRTGFYLDPATREVSVAEFDDPEAYAVDVSRYVPRNISLLGIDEDLVPDKVSENALRFLADYPLTGTTEISFTTREPGYRDPGYSAKIFPPELGNPLLNFVANAAFTGNRPGTLLVNSPLESGDLLDKRLEEGTSLTESNTLRRLMPFVDAGGPLPNLRGLAYSTAGFGPVDTTQQQFSYIDDKGQAIPIQLGRAEGPLRGLVAVKSFKGKPEASVYKPALPASTTSRYYSIDPVTAAASVVPDVLRNVKRVPSSLLPGAADLIPSPEAIRTGYAQGPAAMGKQMAQEFVQSLPTAAGTAMLMSAPAAAPFAPGIGAGMVGVAGARALNEVVRQQTGEGVVPKVRQFLGTAPRTGIAAKPRVGEKPLTATVKPLTTAQRNEIQRQANRGELQRRIDLLKERFDLRRGEFGLSEILSGR